MKQGCQTRRSKTIVMETYLLLRLCNSTFCLLDGCLDLSIVSAVNLGRECDIPTLAATGAFSFLAGAAFFVTPVGLAALVAAVLGPRFAPVLAVAFFFVAVGVGSVIVGKTLGREFPIYQVQQSPQPSYALSFAEHWRSQCATGVVTNQLPIGYPHEPF